MELNSRSLRFRGCLPVDCTGSGRDRSGGLCMLWNEEMDVTLTSFSNNHISVKVTLDNGRGEWFLSGIYGWPEKVNRGKTWELMKLIEPPRDNPWFCMGDFNEILWSSEKKGGNIRFNQNMDHYRSTMTELGMQDLGYRG
ncbi:hypothetical protein ACS0TY_018908 [Phlomoides rotata]